MGPGGLIYLAALVAVFLLAVWVSRDPQAPQPDWMPIDWWPFDSRSDGMEADSRAGTGGPERGTELVSWRQRRAPARRTLPETRPWARR